jgi:hypothetical protein
MNADNRWTKICYNGETSKKAEGEPCIYIWTAWWFTSPTAIVWDKKSDTDITALLLYLWGLTTGDPITAWLWNALLGDENIDITASTVFKKGVVSANWSCVAQEDFINISNRITLKDEANTYNIGTWSL